MEFIKFWSTWNKNYKALYLTLLSLLIAVGLILGFFQVFGLENYSPLEVARKTESIHVPLQQVKGLSIEYTNAFKSYIVFQTTLALKVISVSNYSLLFLAVFTIGLAFLATAATYLSRLWFLLSQALFVIWIITLKVPYLQVLGVSNDFLEYGLIIVFLGLGYLHHAIYTQASLLKKFHSFLALCTLFLGLIYISDSQSNPILFVAHHAIIVPIIVSFIFIANVSYDIILAILGLLSSKKSTDKSGNVSHFVILSVLYLAYVCLTFFRNSLFISWDIIYLDEFFLLTISTVIGIWGFRKRSELIKKQLNFTPLGGYVYLVMAVITFATISWLFATANDALIETFEDMIIFSHIGFGVSFIVFVIFNYLEFLRNGLPITKIIWQPKRLPTPTIRLVGIVIVVILILRANYTPYFQALAGYYNSIATYYMEEGKKEASITSFQISKQYASSSHLSNFNLGLDYYRKQDWVKSSYYFGKATFKNPSVQAFVNRVQAQLNSGVLFEALFTLEDANSVFPNNPFVLNMKGIVFEKLNQVDSAYIYFDKAYQLASNKSIEEVSLVNKLALLAKNNIKEPINLNYLSNQPSVPLMANVLANANLQSIAISNSIDYTLPNDSLLTYNDFSLLFNLLSNQAIRGEITNLNLEPLRSMKANEPFSKSLLYAMAVNNNYAAFQKKSYSQINELENAEISDAGYYHLIHGFWLMDQSAFGMAAEQFAKAEKLKVKMAAECKVIALIKDGRLYEAALSYDLITINDTIKSNDPFKLFFNSSIEGLPLDYKYLWYANNDALTTVEKQLLLEEFEGTIFDSKIKLEEIHNNLISGELTLATNQLKEINIESLNQGVLGDYYNLVALTYSLSNNDELGQLINKDSLTIYPKNYRLLYTSFQASKNKERQTDSLMYTLGIQNAFFEEGIDQAVKYFNNIGKVQEAYTILVEAARLNPSNMHILKAYTLQCLRMNMRSYARSGLEELSKKLTEDDYALFEKEFDILSKAIDEKPW